MASSKVARGKVVNRMYLAYSKVSGVEQRLRMRARQCASRTAAPDAEARTASLSRGPGGQDATAPGAIRSNRPCCQRPGVHAHRDMAAGVQHMGDPRSLGVAAVGQLVARPDRELRKALGAPIHANALGPWLGRTPAPGGQIARAVPGPEQGDAVGCRRDFLSRARRHVLRQARLARPHHRLSPSYSQQVLRRLVLAQALQRSRPFGQKLHVSSHAGATPRPFAQVQRPIAPISAGSASPLRGPAKSSMDPT